jgi:hypothetical protein
MLAARLGKVDLVQIPAGACDLEAVAVPGFDLFPVKETVLHIAVMAGSSASLREEDFPGYSPELLP